MVTTESAMRRAIMRMICGGRSQLYKCKLVRFKRRAAAASEAETSAQREEQPSNREREFTLLAAETVFFGTEFWYYFKICSIADEGPHACCKPQPHAQHQQLNWQFIPKTFPAAAAPEAAG